MSNYPFYVLMAPEGDGQAGGGSSQATPPASGTASNTESGIPPAVPVSTDPPSIIGGEPAPVVISADDQRKFLIEKGGKAEELAKLNDADLKTKFDAAKAAAEVKPAVVKPEDIKITVPDGITIDDKTMSDLKAVIADSNITPTERAQKLVDMHVAALKASVETPLQQWRDTQTKWQGEIKADSEIGGSKLPQTMANMTKAITQVMGADTPAVIAAFRDTGAGNHPAIVKLIARMSQAYVEGKHEAGGAPSSAQPSTQKTLQAMYPSAKGASAPN